MTSLRSLDTGRNAEVFFHLSNKCGDHAFKHKAAMLEKNGALPAKALLRVAIHDELVKFTEMEQKEILKMGDFEITDGTPYKLSTAPVGAFGFAGWVRTRNGCAFSQCTRGM